jgi:FkbM family methyltransferase
MPASDTRSEEVVELLGIRRLTHVVDIGANPIDGEPPYRPLMDAKLCRVTGFEPQAAALAELNLKKGPNEVYFDCAVGDGEEHTLNVCAYSGWTSTLIPRQAALEAFEHFKINARIVGQTRVRTQRLDDIAAIQEIDFLKIDIQGGELSVFVHGREKLKNVVVIQTEVPFVNLYEGQPSFWEVDRELRAQGFIPHAFAELKKWPISPIQNGESPTKPLNQLLEADLVYVRDFTNAEAISNEQLKHLCLIAHACYNSFDLAKRCIAILEQRKCLSAGSLERYVQILRGDKKSAPQPMLSPSDVEAQFIRANELHRSGRFTEAAQGYRAVLEVNAMHFDATHLLGVVSLQQGQYVEAERQIRAAIRLNPEVAAAYSNLGNALQGLRRFGEAEILYNKAITLKPDYAEAFSNCGNALQALKRFEEAVAKYDRAITIAPKYAEAFNNRGNALQALRRYDEALTSYDRAIALKPDYPEAFNNRGNALKRLGRIAEALTSYDKAIALKPDYPDVWNNKGNALQILQRFDEALASYERAIVLRPDYDDAFNNRGIALNALKRSQEALASFDKAIALKPDHADAFNNRGIAFKDLERLDEAMEDYNKAIALRASFVEAFNNRGNLFLKRGRYEGAFADFDQAYSLNPDMRFVEGCRLHAKMHMCDWKDIDSEMARLSQHVRQGKLATEPFMLLPTPASAEDLLRCAEIYTADKYPPYEKPVWKGERYGHDRIRVAYMSGEFRAQATAYLTADLFECHDKRKFETYAFSSGSNDHSAMRKRLESAFDVFADVSLKSDAEIAAFIRKSEIDILVNLNGYFGLDRTGVFAMRPCPSKSII